MKDNIEDFVTRNRAEFDTETPRTKVWDVIKRQLPANKSNRFMWIWQAAAVLFFATSVYLFADRFSGQPMSVASGENFTQVEDFYFREINQKRELILDLSESGVSAEAELQKLDAMYLVLKEQYKENPSEEVLEALTLNLIIRLDLLNQVVADIESEADDADQGEERNKARAEI